MQGFRKVNFHKFCVSVSLPLIQTVSLSQTILWSDSPEDGLPTDRVVVELRTGLSRPAANIKANSPGLIVPSFLRLNGPLQGIEQHKKVGNKKEEKHEKMGNYVSH